MSSPEENLINLSNIFPILKPGVMKKIAGLTAKLRQNIADFDQFMEVNGWPAEDEASWHSLRDMSNQWANISEEILNHTPQEWFGGADLDDEDRKYLQHPEALISELQYRIYQTSKKRTQLWDNAVSHPDRKMKKGGGYWSFDLPARDYGSGIDKYAPMQQMPQPDIQQTIRYAKKWPRQRKVLGKEKLGRSKRKAKTLPYGSGRRGEYL